MGTRRAPARRVWPHREWSRQRWGFSGGAALPLSAEGAYKNQVNFAGSRAFWFSDFSIASPKAYAASIAS